MPKRKQTVYETSDSAAKRARPNEYLRTTEIGIQKNDTGITVQTHVRLYIPTPATASDQPGWFIRMSNGAGSCFARLSGADELRAFGDFILSAAVDLAARQAFDHATQKHRILIQAEKEYQNFLKGEKENDGHYQAMMEKYCRT